MLSGNNNPRRQDTMAQPEVWETPIGEIQRLRSDLSLILENVEQRVEEAMRGASLASDASQAERTWDLWDPTSPAFSRDATLGRHGLAWPGINGASTMPQREPRSDSVPLQIWEGTVLDVDTCEQVMRVQLHAKMGDVPPHSAEIELQWVNEQDRELVQPGAVFYLTLFKVTTRGGSIQNAQELRFRRRPAWSETQIRRIEEDVDMLHQTMRPARTAP